MLKLMRLNDLVVNEKYNICAKILKNEKMINTLCKYCGKQKYFYKFQRCDNYEYCYFYSNEIISITLV